MENARVSHFSCNFVFFSQDDSMGSDISWSMVCSIKSGREPFKSVTWHPTMSVIAAARGSRYEIGSFPKTRVLNAVRIVLKSGIWPM
jgi:hypothetical protein